MSDDPRSIFEQGKQLYDGKRYKEAVFALTKAVSLEPKNADFHAWLARAYNVTQELDKAFLESNIAIDLDKNCGLAFRQRGIVLLRRNNYEGAINDLSRAIEINPIDDIAFYYRSIAYSFIRNYERSIIDKAQYHQITEFYNNEYEASGDQKFDKWYRAAYNHFRKQLLPQINNSNEKFITYWECYAEWGKRAEMSSMKGGYGYSFTHSNFGSGYLCLSDKSIHIVSLGQISIEYPLYLQGKVINAINFFFSQNQILEKKDNILTIPYRTELDVQEVGIIIELFTPILTWMIHPLNPNDKPFILTGIRMGLLGKYENFGTLPSNLPKTTTEEILDLIKKLGDLKIAGIISNEDFEQKKKELLERL